MRNFIYYLYRWWYILICIWFVDGNLFFYVVWGSDDLLWVDDVVFVVVMFVVFYRDLLGLVVRDGFFFFYNFCVVFNWFNCWVFIDIVIILIM